MKTKLTVLLLLAAMTVPATMLGGKRKQLASHRGAQAQPQVILTGDLAAKVYGYQGPTPLKITIKNGVIADIEALENQESPQYFKRATAKVFPQYIGKTVAEGLSLEADGATGATYSSDALFKNIQLGLEQAKTSQAKKQAKRQSRK